MTTFRRTLLAFGATLVMTASGVAARAAGDGAADFVRSLGGQLVAVVNAPGSPASKRRALQPILADHIAVMYAGRIVERGTHAELMAADHIGIGTSIYNFTNPANLKAYIDHIVRGRRDL